LPSAGARRSSGSSSLRKVAALGLSSSMSYRRAVRPETPRAGMSASTGSPESIRSRMHGDRASHATRRSSNRHSGLKKGRPGDTRATDNNARRRHPSPTRQHRSRRHYRSGGAEASSRRLVGDSLCARLVERGVCLLVPEAHLVESAGALVNWIWSYRRSCTRLLRKSSRCPSGIATPTSSSARRAAEAGGIVVSEHVTLEFDISATKNTGQSTCSTDGRASGPRFSCEPTSARRKPANRRRLRGRTRRAPSERLREAISWRRRRRRGRCRV
jgi:hypothetical protein